MISLKRCLSMVYKRATPLTVKELREIGLKEREILEYFETCAEFRAASIFIYSIKDKRIPFNKILRGNTKGINSLKRHITGIYFDRISAIFQPYILPREVEALTGLCYDGEYVLTRIHEVYLNETESGIPTFFFLNEDMFRLVIECLVSRLLSGELRFHKGKQQVSLTPPEKSELEQLKKDHQQNVESDEVDWYKNFLDQPKSLMKMKKQLEKLETEFKEKIVNNNINSELLIIRDNIKRKNRESSRLQPCLDGNISSYEDIYRYKTKADSYSFNRQGVWVGEETVQNPGSARLAQRSSRNPNLPDVLYVYKSNVICLRQRHSTFNKEIKYKFKSGKEAEFIVSYCPTCKKYFIHNTYYEKLRERYPNLPVIFAQVDRNGNFPPQTILKEKSVLAEMGYSVRKNGISTHKRREILIQAISERVLSKDGIINYLSYLINYNGKRSGMEDAVAEWKADIEYLQTVNVRRDGNVTIEKIEKYR